MPEHKSSTFIPFSELSASLAFDTTQGLDRTKMHDNVTSRRLFVCMSVSLLATNFKKMTLTKLTLRKGQAKASLGRVEFSKPFTGRKSSARPGINACMHAMISTIVYMARTWYDCGLRT